MLRHGVFFVYAREDRPAINKSLTIGHPNRYVDDEFKNAGNDCFVNALVQSLRHAPAIISYINPESHSLPSNKELGNRYFVKDGWRGGRPTKVQRNNYDCGPLCLANAEAAAKGTENNMQNDKMAEFRLMMAKRILGISEKKLQKPSEERTGLIFPQEHQGSFLISIINDARLALHNVNIICSRLYKAHASSDQPFAL